MTKKQAARRGRPAKLRDPQMIAVYMERADVERMKLAAAAAGKNVTEWAREKLAAAARRAVKSD